MTFLFLTVLYAILWMAIGNSFTLLNLILGLGLAAMSLALVREEIVDGRIRLRPLRIALLAGLFLRELLLSAWRVARIVLARRLDIRPGIFAYPLSVTRDFEISLLANMITLTPGTLSVDVSADRRTLFVHALDCSDPETACRDIADGFERRIAEAFR